MHPFQASQNPTTPPHPLTSQLQYPHSEKKTSQWERVRESVRESPRRKKTLSLEDHALFLEDPFNDDALTTARINQVSGSFHFLSASHQPNKTLFIFLIIFLLFLRRLFWCMDSEEHTSTPRHVIWPLLNCCIFHFIFLIFRATQRSTLEDNFLPYDDASLSLGEAKQDLESLKWQECSDQSIETVLFDHNTNDEVISNGHDDALKSFVRSSQEEEKI